MNFSEVAERWLKLGIDALLQSCLDQSAPLAPIAPSTHRVTTVGPSPNVVVGPDHPQRLRSSVIVVNPSAQISVQPPRRAVWDDQGWRRTTSGKTHIYEGQYVVRRRGGATASFAGRIVEDGRSIAAYIADPPPEIKRHPKGPC